MLVSKLRQKHLVEIVRRYESQYGAQRSFDDVLCESPADVLIAIKRNGRADYRIGSKWSMHSKLMFANRDKHLGVDFYTNMDRGSNDYAVAEQAAQKFNREISDYLNTL